MMDQPIMIIQLALYCLLIINTETCGIGRTSFIEGDLGTPMSGQYLDTAHPATCNGKITGITFCHPSSAILQGRHRVILKIWRFTSNVSMEIIKRVHVTFQDSVVTNSVTTICTSMPLNSTDNFYLVQGDVLGIQIPSNLSNTFLPTVISEGTDADGPGLSQDKRNASEFEQPLNLDRDLIFLNTLVLNIHAKIIPFSATNSPDTNTGISTLPPMNGSSLDQDGASTTSNKTHSLPTTMPNSIPSLPSLMPMIPGTGVPTDPSQTAKKSDHMKSIMTEFTTDLASLQNFQSAPEASSTVGINDVESDSSLEVRQTMISSSGPYSVEPGSQSVSLRHPDSMFKTVASDNYIVHTTQFMMLPTPTPEFVITPTSYMIAPQPDITHIVATSTLDTLSYLDAKARPSVDASTQSQSVPSSGGMSTIKPSQVIIQSKIFTDTPPKPKYATPLPDVSSQSDLRSRKLSKEPTITPSALTEFRDTIVSTSPLGLEYTLPAPTSTLNSIVILSDSHVKSALIPEASSFNEVETTITPEVTSEIPASPYPSIVPQMSFEIFPSPTPSLKSMTVSLLFSSLEVEVTMPPLAPTVATDMPALSSSIELGFASTLTQATQSSIFVYPTPTVIPIPVQASTSAILEQNSHSETVSYSVNDTPLETASIQSSLGIETSPLSTRGFRTEALLPASSSLSSSLMTTITLGLYNQTPEYPMEEHSASMILAIVAVSVIFATLSSCIVLLSMYVKHCRKIPIVDQMTSRGNVVLEMDNPSYFMKSSEEGITSIPMNEISTENNPNAITISMESTAGSNDNIVWNSPYTESNSGPAAIKTNVARNQAPSKTVNEIELKNIQQNPSPFQLIHNEVSQTHKILTLPRMYKNSSQCKHNEEQKDKIFPEGKIKRSNFVWEHDYDEPRDREVPFRPKRAGSYEQPISIDWKRLSMPSLDDFSPLPPPPQLQRRNSSVCELSSNNDLLHNGKPQNKPFRIRHYAEFSLFPSAQNESKTSDKMNSVTSNPTPLVSIKAHDYELPSNSFRRYPSLYPIPAPAVLLKRRPSEYETPVSNPPLQRSKSSRSLMHHVKHRLNQFSVGVNMNAKDEAFEKLLRSQSITREGSFSSQFGREVTITRTESCAERASPAVIEEPNTQRESDGNTIKSSEMDGAYFFPSPDENELKEALKKLSVKMLSHTAIESSLTKEQVQHGIWRKGPDETRVDVTIKSVHSEESESNKKLNRSLLLQEIAIMGQFRHPNVVKLHGAVYDQTHTMLVSEYFPRGDLRKILVQMGRSVKPLDTPKLLLTYSQQVALGMQYLASKGFVHRGLCASNIFVTNMDTCKVGGFGKSRDLSDVNDYVARGGRLQVRWTAPEAMYYRQYSTASDVWSYGCLLYEIWSLGRMPFRDFSNAEVIEKVDSGYRLPPPPGCPRVIYNLMTQCWHPNPFSRPCFKEIINTLLRDEDRILQIPFKDASTHEAAIILGANLKAGAYMYSDLQLRYVKKSSDPLMNGSVQSHDYDHIEDEKFMLSFPTSSADLACETKSRREEENDEGGVSLVPQPSIYSRPVELSNCLSSNNFMSVQYNPYDYEDIVDF